MTALPEFLLARIAEDETRAKAAWSLVPWVHIANAAAANDQRDAGLLVLEWRPKRVLAECEAKRRIVAYAVNHPDGIRGSVAARYSVKCLALPYADHPDYREEWKP